MKKTHIDAGKEAKADKIIKTIKAPKTTKAAKTEKSRNDGSCAGQCGEKTAAAAPRGCVAKGSAQARKTRADMRQEARVKKLDDMVKGLSKMLGRLFDEIRDLKFKNLPGIDQNMLLMAFNSLETFITALNMRKQWERVRVRTSSGEKLNKCVVGFWDFAFGRGMLRKRGKKSDK
jgi:hypothetical protein